MSLPFDLRSINHQTLFYNPTMDRNILKSGESTPAKAQHLCVLIHGLWGNSQHLNYIAQTLRKKHGEDELIILACKRNASSFTYDGIEIGGERVAREIEETIEELAKDGYKITRLSVVGYSLGGLIARYAIGLLDHKGYFKHIQPANFTTFASPHLGVRTPLVGYANHLWNVLGARTLSASGRQLFAIDNFRNTGRSLLSVLADPDSIFIHALAQFERRTLYTNIVNDRSAVYYTTGIAKTDPYTTMDKVKLNYVQGYEPVILDPDHPCDLKQDQDSPTFYERVRLSSSALFRRTPVYLALTLLIPIGIAAFLVNSTIQTFRSRRRIMLHESDSAGEGFGVYRIPYVVREVRAGLEDAFGSTNAAQEQDYLPAGDPMDRRSGLKGTTNQHMLAEPEFPTGEKAQGGTVLASKSGVGSIGSTTTHERSPSFPILALTDSQFEMIESLDTVGFRKYPVHIHSSNHSHAAIIVRHERGAFDDGKVVIRHWLENEFQL